MIVHKKIELFSFFYLKNFYMIMGGMRTMFDATEVRHVDRKYKARARDESGRGCPVQMGKRESLCFASN